MVKKYFVDTCIWRDFYENRFSKTGNPLGQYATNFFLKVIKNKDKILFSSLTVNELNSTYNEEEIFDMLNFLFLTNLLVKVEITKEEFKEAQGLAVKRNLPIGDCLIAVQARNNNAIVLTQDKHFESLLDIADVIKP